MTDDFKKWLCELAGYETTSWCGYIKKGLVYDLRKNDVPLEILIKAMWIINRGGRRFVNMNWEQITIYAEGPYHLGAVYSKKYNNSEQEALTAALEYIYEQEKK